MLWKLPSKLLEEVQRNPIKEKQSWGQRGKNVPRSKRRSGHASHMMDGSGATVTGKTSFGGKPFWNPHIPYFLHVMEFFLSHLIIVVQIFQNKLLCHV